MVHERKSSFLEDNMPEHAIDIFIENATKMVLVIPLNAKNEDQTLRYCVSRFEVTPVFHFLTTLIFTNTIDV